MTMATIRRASALILAVFVLGLAFGAMAADKGKTSGKPAATKTAPKPGPALMSAPAPSTPGGEAGGEDPYAEDVAEANLESVDNQVETLDKEMIAAAVSKRMSAIRDCYERELQTNQKLKGLIKVSFTIQTKGDVTEVVSDKEKTTLTDKKVLGCVLDVVKKLKFPVRKTGEPQPVSYPFRFQPREDKK